MATPQVSLATGVRTWSADTPSGSHQRPADWDLAQQARAVGGELPYDLAFRDFDHNDALEGHMASYVDFIMGEGRPNSSPMLGIDRRSP